MTPVNQCHQCTSDTTSEIQHKTVNKVLPLFTRSMQSNKMRSVSSVNLCLCVSLIKNTRTNRRTQEHLFSRVARTTTATHSHSLSFPSTRSLAAITSAAMAQSAVPLVSLAHRSPNLFTDELDHFSSHSSIKPVQLLFQCNNK